MLSQRRSVGPRPRRLTKDLQPSSQCPMGTYQSHRDPDVAECGGWCVYTRDTRQGPDITCFSSSSGFISGSGPTPSHMVFTISPTEDCLTITSYCSWLVFSSRFWSATRIFRFPTKSVCFLLSLKLSVVKSSRSCDLKKHVCVCMWYVTWVMLEDHRYLESPILGVT